VHFGGVQYMLLRPYYDGLTVRQGGDRERDQLRQLGVWADKGDLYLLGPGLSSFVISGPVQWHEDEGDVRDPSWFGPVVGTS
jgi:hypothetical protein